jgi:hypothetical protein
MNTPNRGKAAIGLSDEEVPTILAALRLFQKTYRYLDPEAIAADFPTYFSTEQFRFGVVVDPPPFGGGRYR